MLDNIITNTTGNVQSLINPKNLGGLIFNTTGDAARLAMSGVITRTTRGTDHLVSAQKGSGGIAKTKTHSKRYGQVPYAGPKY